MHNNWLLGERIKLEQHYDCQWFNCARATTLGNQVCFNLIIMRYPRIARAVVNIQMFIYLYWGGQCDGRYSGKTSACRYNGLGSCIINTLHTHINQTTGFSLGPMVLTMFSFFSSHASMRIHRQILHSIIILLELVLRM